MKKRALSLAMALAMCLSLAVPALAAEESLTRLGFARLLVQYVKPEGEDTEELPSDCAGLSKEDKDIVTTVLGAGWMYGDGEGNFLPDETVSYSSAIPVIARILDPEQESSTMPKLPEDRPATDQEMEANTRLMLEWTEKMQSRFHAPAWICADVEVLYNKGVIQAVNLDDWDVDISRNDTEDLLKAAFAGGKAVNLPNEDSEPEQPTEPTPPPAGPAPAAPTNDTLTCNGTLQSPTVYKINGSNYFKIRDLAAILNGTEKQFSVGYDAALSSVTATTGQGYEKQPGDLSGAPAGGQKTGDPSNDAIYINGEKITAEVYKIDGSNYFKLRDLGKALDFYVGWSQDAGVFIQTDKPYSE